LVPRVLSQSIYHVSNSSPYLRKYYCELTDKRGCGKACIALIRKGCSIMRRMLLNGEELGWIDEYEQVIPEMKEERKSA